MVTSVMIRFMLLRIADIMMHCPDAVTVDEIRRLEGLGATDLQHNLE